MFTRRYPCALWCLLLLHVSASALKFNLFNKDPVVREGAVRLSGSPSPWEGRVEVYHAGQWGTACDDGWDMSEARVVCRQLGFPAARSVLVGKDYGQATGPIWLDDIKCEGTESSLFSCGFKSWGVTDCTHKEDVGVICESASTNLTINSTHVLDHSGSLSDEFGALFDSGDGCDLNLLVQSASGNTRENGSLEIDVTTICAHKLILARFPLFNVSEDVTSISVNISQTCQPHFASFIRYIYTRKVDVSFSSVQCLHWFASEFGVKQLMEDAGRLFSRILPEDVSFHTQVSLYQYAVDTEDFVLQENCIQYLAWNIQNLTMSPAWPSLSAEVLGALLARSDLVVPDEYFLLQAVESWILENGSSLNLRAQAALVGRIRFPMIPAEKLYQLEVNSSLYNTHKEVYSSRVLKALKFNVLLFSNLVANPKFVREDEDYHPRIYTAEPWSTAVNPSRTARQSNPVHYYSSHSYDTYGMYYPNPQTASSFTTPFHNSMIFKDKTIRWDANIFKSKSECSNRGVMCESVPAARLTSNSQPSNVRFLNRLLLVCQGKYICQIQDFKSNMAYIADHEAQALAYPCPDGKYTYRFVIRPEYV